MSIDRHPPALRAARGLSLLETLLCIALLGILASLAAPSFRNALSKHRIAAVRTELATSIQWARWEALRRNTLVTILRRTDCSTTLAKDDDWHCGWQMVAGPHITKASQVKDTEVLQAFSVPKDLRLVHPGGGQALQFSRSGYPVLVANKFIVGLPGDAKEGIATTRQTVTLCMNRTGKVRATEGQTTC